MKHIHLLLMCAFAIVAVGCKDTTAKVSQASLDSEKAFDDILTSTHSFQYPIAIGSTTNGSMASMSSDVVVKLFSITNRIRIVQPSRKVRIAKIFVMEHKEVRGTILLFQDGAFAYEQYYFLLKAHSDVLNQMDKQ